MLGAAAGLREPRLRIGQPCSFVLFDPEEEWHVGAEPLHSRSANTPLLGVSLRGRVLLTVAEGTIVHLSPSLELPGLTQGQAVIAPAMSGLGESPPREG